MDYGGVSMSGIRLNSKTVTTASGKLRIPDAIGDSICHSAKMTSQFISLPDEGKPLTLGDIESKLRQGNSALTEHLPVAIDSRNEAKQLWVKTILAEFNIKPEELKGKDKEITKLIPEMAASILDALNSNPNSESSGGLTSSALVSLTPENPAGSLEHLSVEAVNPKDLLAPEVHTLVALLGSGDATPALKEDAVFTLLMDLDSQLLFKAGGHIQLGLLLVDPTATPAAKESAAMALVDLSTNYVDSHTLVKAGVHTQLGLLLSDGAATDQAKEYAATVLANLSMNYVDSHTLVKAGVHIQLGLLLVDPTATPAAKENAAKALAHLSMNYVDSQTLVEAGVHIQLGLLLRDEAATDQAKENAAGAFCNLSANPANRETIVKAGVDTQLGVLLDEGQFTDQATFSARGALLNLSMHVDLSTSEQAVPPLIPGLAGDHSTEQGFTTDLMGNMFKGQRDEAGKPSKGILILNGRSTLEGVFKDGKLEGVGKLTLLDDTSLDDTSITGEFRQGHPIGVCTLTSPNGRKTEYQATYTGDDKKITKEELNRRMAAPRFVELLTGFGDDGAIRGYVLPLISTHLECLSPTTSPMEKLASQLDFAAEIENEKEASISIGKIKGRLDTADKEVVIPYGRDKHAMLLKLKFTDLGLNVEIYNSGEGLPEHHAHHPQSEGEKYNTCKEKLYPDMSLDSHEFNTLLTNILKYKTFKTIDQSYEVFEGAQDVVGGTPNWQRDQKAGNCTLECVMAFLKKNMPPADYLQYRMTLISDVKTQAEAHKGSYEETLSQTVSNRLDEMLENRKVKQILYPSEPVDNHPALVESGAHISLSALRALLSNSEETPRAKQIAAGALVKLTLTVANRQPLVEAGVHISLKALIDDPSATSDAKQWAAMALCSLSKTSANHQPLVAAGVHISLKALIDDPSATPEAKKFAAVALFKLSLDAANHQPLVEAGVHISLKELIDDPSATPDTKQYAAMALWSLSKTAANHQPLVEAGVHISLKALIDDPSATSDAKKIARTALANLRPVP